MDEKDSQETPAADFNKLDLNQLQSFSFGTQWTQDKSSPADKQERDSRPRRDDRRDGREEPRRDRRSFRKPAGDGGAPSGPGGPASSAGREGGPAPRRDFGGDRRDRQDNRGAPRGDSRFAGRGELQMDRGPYDSPHFAIEFYPEDASFAALAKTIRASCRTIELFEIARTVIGKNDRFVAVLARKPSAGDTTKRPIYISVPDGLPFDTEEEVVHHVLSQHLGLFFEQAEVEVDPPKGNFQVINKCGITGELLGPPNYHRYNQIAEQHYAKNISRMSPEAYRSRIETIRDPEVVAQWLEKMKKVTRFTWKTPGAAKPVAPAPVAEKEETPAVAPVENEAALPADNETPVAAETSAAETPVAETPVAETTPAPAEAPAALTFDTIDEARLHLLSSARERVFKTVETARFHGRLIEQIPAGEIRRAVDGALERQRRFPLDTANGLRGRLRREHFTIFKKGSKGVSYVCAVKRKFRTPSQTFAETIDALISFIEKHPMVRLSDLAAKFLGITPPAAASAPAAESAEGAAGAPAAETTELTIEQRERLTRMQGNLRWLVMEGYVTEFIDGRLFAPPPMAETRKGDAHSEENDPENFPDAPESEPAAPVKPAPKAVAKPAVKAETEVSPEAPAPAAPASAEPTTPTDSTTDEVEIDPPAHMD